MLLISILFGIVQTVVGYSNYICAHSDSGTYYTSQTTPSWPAWDKISEISTLSCIKECQPCVTYNNYQIGYSASCLLTPLQQDFLHIHNQSNIPTLSSSQVRSLYKLKPGIYIANENHPFIHKRTLCIIKSGVSNDVRYKPYTNIGRNIVYGQTSKTDQIGPLTFSQNYKNKPIIKPLSTVSKQSNIQTVSRQPSTVSKPSNFQTVSRQPSTVYKPPNIQTVSRPSATVQTVQTSSTQSISRPSSIQNSLSQPLLSPQATDVKPIQPTTIIAFYESILFYACVSFVVIILILIIIILYKTKSKNITEVS
jgi:hypothetical protein